MDIQQSLIDMQKLFMSRMGDFEKQLQGNQGTASTSTNIQSEFFMFRSFVISSLNTLNAQVDLLVKMYDQIEMKSRRKILLVHGVTEEKKEDTSVVLLKLIKDHLKLPDTDANSIVRCHRMGPVNDRAQKPRPVLIKFKEISTRNRIWFAKTAFKNTGITVSEFLTKSRHETFMNARKQFGVSNCWTRDGNIFVIDSHGKRHRVSSMDDLKTIPGPSDEEEPAHSVTAATTRNDPKCSKVVRSTRTATKAIHK